VIILLDYICLYDKTTILWVHWLDGHAQGEGGLKKYFITSLILFFLFIGVSFGIFGTVNESTDSFVLVLDDTEEFLDGTANLLCKDTGLGRLFDLV